MKTVNYFNLILILTATLLTFQAVEAKPMCIHVMQNISKKNERQDVYAELKNLGYVPSEKKIFSQSPNTLIITQTLKDERDPASITLELVHLDAGKAIPRTLFHHRLALEGDGKEIEKHIHDLMKTLPSPEILEAQSNFILKTTVAQSK